MTLTRPRLAIVGVLSLVALTGCSGSGSGSTAAAANQSALSARGADSANVGDTGNGQAPSVAFAQTDPSKEVVQKAVIKNGEIEIRTSDPQQARDRVDALLNRLHGSIDDEQTVYDTHGQIKDSHLVLRVPVASFTPAIDRIERLGTVVHSSATGKDVTTQVIDVQQRLKTLRISLRDLNSFQRQAVNIDQLLRFENAITQRRGEYQSLKAQRNHLVNETSMSTISLEIAVPAQHVTPPAHHHHKGFLAGLHHGWSAFTGTVVVALTAVGAALPFAVLLALIGLPLWWWLRRTSGAVPAAAPAEAPSGE